MPFLQGSQRLLFFQFGLILLLNLKRTGQRGVFRLMLLTFGAAIVMRKGAAAAVLWQWNPTKPDATAFVLYLQRIIDPIADVLQMVAFGLSFAAATTLIKQLRREPWKVPIWESLDRLKRPTLFALFSLIAAFGVVWTR